MRSGVIASHPRHWLISLPALIWGLGLDSVNRIEVYFVRFYIYGPLLCLYFA